MEQEVKEYEKCILCGNPTEIEKNKNIDARIGYLEGAGQMCPKCFLDYYKKVYIENGRNR